MDDATKKMTDGLLSAMKAEAEGHHFYRMAALTTQDDQGKKIFEQLAQEEQEHLTFLGHQYRSVLETGRGDASTKLGTPGLLEGASPIFSAQIRTRIQEAHFEMTALSVGIQLELSAQQYYQQAAKEATDETVKRFYTDLVKWEAGHYHALLRQQESLKEDYWSSAGFAPF